MAILGDYPAYRDNLCATAPHEEETGHDDGEGASEEATASSPAGWPE